MLNITNGRNGCSVLGVPSRGGCSRSLYTERNDKIRVVTAYGMTGEQQRLYLEGSEYAEKAGIAIPKFRNEAEEAVWWIAIRKWPPRS